MLHHDLSQEQWNSISIIDQMANIGTDVGRAINWAEKDKNKSNAACERAIELLDLTISDPKNTDHLKELCRVREIVTSYFYADGAYGYTADSLNDYFTYYAYASAAVRESTYKHSRIL